jgi:hypothetical protein
MPSSTLQASGPLVIFIIVSLIVRHVGPGGNTSERVPIEHLLTAREARDFTIDGVFLEHPHWIDFNYLF